jgi:bloom syndrome protein
MRRADCQKKLDCEGVAQMLQSRGFSAECYHASIKADARSDLLLKWTNNSIRIMVATVAFGMGIDKKDVRFVIHYSIPKSMEGESESSHCAACVSSAHSLSASDTDPKIFR